MLTRTRRTEKNVNRTIPRTEKVLKDVKAL